MAVDFACDTGPDVVDVTQDTKTDAGNDAQDVAQPAACTSSCADWNPCTEDSCVDGTCIHTPQDAPCNDSDACTLGDHCLDGLCVPQDVTTCDDGLACTVDTCAPCVGCRFLVDKAQCDDGNSCTLDGCSAEGCTHTLTCEDGNPCTVDACVGLACAHTPADLPGCCTGLLDFAKCDDGDPCTFDDCTAYTCQHVKTQWDCCTKDSDCPAQDLCAVVTCDMTQPVQGHGACQATPIPGCVVPGCVAGDPNACDDGYSCNIDWCTPGNQCAHAFTSYSSCCWDKFDCNLDWPCLDATCAHPSSQCVYEPLPEGTPCGQDKICDFCGVCVPK